VQDLKRRVSELSAALDLVIELARCGRLSQPLLKVGEEARILIERERERVSCDIAEVESGDPSPSSPSRFVLLKYQQQLELVWRDVMYFASSEAQDAACSRWEFLDGMAGYQPDRFPELAESISEWKSELLALVSTQPSQASKNKTSRGRPPDVIEQDVICAFEEAGRPLDMPEFRRIVKGVRPDYSKRNIELLLRQLKKRVDGNKNLETGLDL
jgi:hypothetical protein